MPALLLCAAGVILYLTLGTFVLLWLGVRYEADGGIPFVKIYPGTYLILAAVLWRLLSTDHPLRTMGQLARSRPGLWLYCGGMAVIFVYALAIRGLSGVAFLVDAYVAPGLLALLLSQAPAKFLRFLATLMIALLTVNAACGIIEARLHQHLFPYIIDGQQINETYFRATAFNGHPLRNAMLTGIAMLAVTAAPWPMLVRVGLLSVLGMGLFAFGGRAALIVSALGCMLIIGRELRQSASTDPRVFGRKVLVLTMTTLVVLVTVAFVFGLTGFGARIRAGEIADSSSAARLQVFEIFKLTDLEGLLGGYSAKSIDAMAKVSGLIAVENFWVYQLLFLGLIGFVIWLPAFISGLASVWHHAGFAGRVIVVCFLLIASSNNSLAKKDSSLSLAFAFAIAAAVPEWRAMRAGRTTAAHRAELAHAG